MLLALLCLQSYSNADKSQ